MKVLLIDDHTLFAQALSESIEKYNKLIHVDIVTKIPKDLDSFIQSIIKRYDLILMDLNLTKASTYSGFDISEKILSISPSEKIVALTGFDMPMYKEEAKRIGLRGFITKEETTVNLLNKLKAIFDGKLLFERDNSFNKLTDREVEIVRTYCSGKTRQEVAIECYISLSSLATALSRIYSKLEVNNYQDLYKKALELGYIKIDFI